jgi:hypothetical protein
MNYTDTDLCEHPNELPDSQQRSVESFQKVGLQENHSYKPGGFRAGKHGSAPFLRF